MGLSRLRFTLVAAALVTACSPGPSADPGTTEVPSAPTSVTSTRPAAPNPTQAPTTSTPSPFARPDWLGSRPLELRPDGHGISQPTPTELQDRRLETVDMLPPPAGEEFEWAITDVPVEVLLRSTWSEDCPLKVTDLAYVTVSHVGFDGELHTGELIVNAVAAEELVGVFRQLHAVRFPIEQMRVVSLDELDAPPTGDGNDTTSFVCRPAVGSSRWSQHAFGLAVDVNPFHNPYLKGDLVLPELASAYTDRSVVRPGMVLAGDPVTQAFASIGWGWGGDWTSLKDWMHFSSNGR